MDRRERAKRGFEAELIRPLGLAIFQYIEAWQRFGGSVPMMEKIAHHNALQRVLERHYSRVMLGFQGRELDPEPDLQTAAVSMAVAEKYRARAMSSTHWIIKGVERDLAAALVEATAEKSSDVAERKDDAPFSVSISVRFKEAAKKAWQKAKGRLKAMANIETEAPAEETTYEWVKQNEANARIYKCWNNPMDGKERVWHREAHQRYSQTGIPVDQTFEVGGERLRFPGDRSLGASLANVINCRCWLTYKAVKADGSELPLPISTPKVPTARPFRPGDKPGDPTPIRPTSLVTLNGRTRARIVLGDGRTLATMEQITPSQIVIRVNRNEVARAATNGGRVTQLTIAPGYEGQGIETLIRNSVRHSAEHIRRNSR